MKKNPKILILVGCPCSGKSTFAEYHSKFNDVMRINRDELRQMLRFAEQLEPEDEALLTRMSDKMIEVALQKGRDVVIDNTNTKREFLQQIIDRFNPLADIEFKIFDIPLLELKARNAVRSRKVPIKVIESMYQRLVYLKQNFDFSVRPRAGQLPDDKSRYLIQNTDLQQVVLCDLDGTLALPNGRNMFRPSDEQMYADTLNEPVAQALRGMMAQNKIIFLSGREDLFYDITKRWIIEKAGITDFELFMRAEGDSRKDSIVKLEIVKEKIMPRYNITGVFDDRLQVCRMWYENGIFCFNVNQGLVEF